MPRRSTKTSDVDPISLCTAAFKNVKDAADYHAIVNTTEPEVRTDAWNKLSTVEQERIKEILNTNNQPLPQAVAAELMDCETLVQLKAIKSRYGEELVKAAWKLLATQERDRLKLICQPQTEQNAKTPVSATSLSLVPQEKPPSPKRTLFNISDDLEKLNELLDETGDDTQQQELISQWFSLLGEERDRKLDAYAALIAEMQARAEVRKAEAKRMMELAATDENRAKLLKDRLKLFFEKHELKTLETARYKLSIAKNSTRPLIVNPNVAIAQLPEEYKKVSVELDTAAVREALKQGVDLDFAQLGEAGTHIRIR